MLNMKAGTNVVIPTTIYAPISFADEYREDRHTTGEIVELLANGGAAVKFDNYRNVVDYSASEVRQFIAR
jgi:hypothetical protein